MVPKGVIPQSRFNEGRWSVTSANERRGDEVWIIVNCPEISHIRYCYNIVMWTSLANELGPHPFDLTGFHTPTPVRSPWYATKAISACDGPGQWRAALASLQAMPQWLGIGSAFSYGFMVMFTKKQENFMGSVWIFIGFSIDFHWVSMGFLWFLSERMVIEWIEWRFEPNNHGD